MNGISKEQTSCAVPADTTMPTSQQVVRKIIPIQKSSALPVKRKGMRIERNENGPPVDDDFSDIPDTVAVNKSGKIEINTSIPVHEQLMDIDNKISEMTFNGQCYIFRQNGRIVIVLTDEDNITKICQVTPDNFPAYISPFITFYTIKKKKDGTKYREYLSSCPQHTAKAFLTIEGQSKIPSLLGVLNTPTLRVDQTIADIPGYDSQSRLFLVLDQEFPPISEEPTKDDALEALSRIRWILKDFPFETPASESVILSAFLTAVTRRTLPSAPAIGITAPTMGTGKSLLSDLISIMATGQQAQCMPLPFDEGEVVKTLLSTLMSGVPILTIDNIESHVRSAALCTILTQPTFKSRILGVSREAVVQTNIMVILNGNNLTIRGDMTTRVILCSLDAKEERPQSREFSVDAKEYMMEHRGQMVSDALTIMRAYAVSPEKVSVTPYGRFETWSRVVREPLIWLGCADPLDTVENIEANDPVRLAHTEVLAALYDCWKSRPFFSKEAVTECGNGSADQMRKRKAVYEALESAVLSARGLNARTCGALFRQLEKRVYGGLRLVRAGMYQGVEQWKVECIDEAGGFGENKPTKVH